MSPEQARGDQSAVGPASDVYSLGAVLYELVTGRPPFQADTPVRTLMQVLEHEAPAPSLLNPQVPKDLEVICMKCLHKNPEQHYESAHELADDLGRLLTRKSIAARSTGLATRIFSWVRRNPWSLVGGGSALVVTLAGVSYWLWVERLLAVRCSKLR